MTKPTRPSKFTIVDSERDKHNHVMLWVNLAGSTLCFQITDNAIATRKVAYGYTDEKKVIEAIVAEHLDRFDAQDVDWDKQTAPPRPANPKNHRGWKGAYDCPAKAPAAIQENA